MAIAQFKVKVGSKGKALPHANYVMREDKYGDKLGKHANGIDKEVEYTRFGNMPSWIDGDPKKFWENADKFERSNGTTYREYIISLPRGLDLDKSIELIDTLVYKRLHNKHAYQYAMHNPPASDGGENRHVHLMFSERINDGIERSPDTYFKRYNSKYPERGGARKASFAQTWTERKKDLKELRAYWEVLCNEYLEANKIDDRIDMRNWKERGLTEQPVNISMKDMLKPEVKQAYLEQLTAKRSVEKLEQEIEQVDITITDKNIADYNSGAEKRATFHGTTTARATEIKLTSQREIERADGLKLTAQQEIERADGLKLAAQQRIAEIQQHQAEQQRLAEQQRQAELQRQAQQRLAEEKRQAEQQRQAQQRLAEEKRQAEQQRQAQQRLAEEKRQAEQLERLNNPLYRTPKDLFKFLVNAVTPRRKEVADEKGLGNNLVAIDYAFEQYQQNKELGLYVDYSEEESYRVTKYVTNSYNLKSTAERVFLAVRSAFKPNNKSIIDDYRNIGVGEFCEKYKIDIDNKQINQYHAENPRYTLTQAQSQQSVEDLTGFKMRVNFMRNNRKFKIEDLTVAEYQRIDLNSNDVIFDVKHMIWEANQIANPNLRELNKFLAENCYKTDFQKAMQQLNLKQFLDRYPINIEPKDVLAHAPKQTIQVSEPTPPVLDTPRPTINRPKFNQ